MRTYVLRVSMGILSSLVLKDLLIVEGETSRSGVGNDLFDNAHSIKRIICPARDAYAYIEQIQQAIIQHAENRLILLMLGPMSSS